MKIKQELSYYTCDQVAECIDGVSKELYRALWDVVVDLEQQQTEAPETPDGRATIEDCWHLFSEDMQKQINNLKII